MFRFFSLNHHQGATFFTLKLLICCPVMLYCHGVMAACRVVYEMFSDVNVTVAGPRVFAWLRVCCLVWVLLCVLHCIWNVALFRSETGTVGKNEERIINAFETWCWKRILKTKWTDRITNGEVFQRAKEEILLLKLKEKNRRHSWIGHTVRHNEFAVNILEGAIFGKKAVGRPRLQYLKQVARNTAADSYRAMERMACDNYRWKAANQSKYWGMGRRRRRRRRRRKKLVYYI